MSVVVEAKKQLKQKGIAKALQWLLEDFWEGQIKDVEAWEDIEEINGLEGVHFEQMLEQALDTVLDELDSKCVLVEKEQLQKLPDALRRMFSESDTQMIMSVFYELLVEATK